MQVMILAAGKSTRLGALGAVRPKPLLPICGYPAIAYGLTACARAGLTDVVINLHHHGEQIRRELGDGAALGVKIRYSDEADELLGTGGGIARARALFRAGPLLVVNGKVVADLDLRAVVEAHRAAPAGTVATMVLREDPQPDRFSPVEVDALGRVVALRGHRSGLTPVGPLAARMFTGIHVLGPALLDRLPAGVSDVIADAYLPALLAGQRIGSLTMTGYFAEHSTPDRYLEGNLALLGNPGLVKQPPGALVGVDPDARIAPGARLVPPVRIGGGAIVEDGATVGPLVVLGAGARVRAGARVERCVVWEGAVVEGEQRGRVVMGGGGR
jgi:mannose-1-phosphate guanylyltransferase